MQEGTEATAVNPHQGSLTQVCRPSCGGNTGTGRKRPARVFALYNMPERNLKPPIDRPNQNVKEAEATYE